MSRPLLFERFADLADRLPWVELADSLPTPVEHLSELGDAWGLPALYAKREDQTSSVYGGNKVRKLEWLLGEVVATGRTSVLTTGAWGSHHAYATAVYARRLGIKCTVVSMPQPPTRHVADMFAATSAAATRVIRAHSIPTVPLALARARAAATLAKEGWPYAIPPGGSNARGTLGYVELALELARQVEADVLPAPRFVHVAAGTCGTAAGLSVGLAIAATRVGALRATEVVATRVVPAIMANGRRMKHLQRGVARLLTRCGADVPAMDDWAPIHWIRDQLGDGYGHETAEGRTAAAEARALGHLPAEPTYTAKALAGMRAFVAENGARRRAVHLWMHTAAPTPRLDGPRDDASLPAALRGV